MIEEKQGSTPWTEPQIADSLQTLLDCYENFCRVDGRGRLEAVESGLLFLQESAARCADEAFLEALHQSQSYRSRAGELTSAILDVHELCSEAAIAKLSKTAHVRFDETKLSAGLGDGERLIEQLSRPMAQIREIGKQQAKSVLLATLHSRAARLLQSTGTRQPMSAETSRSPGGGTVDEPVREKKKKRGRPSDTDHKEDRKMFDGWETGRFKTYRDLAAEFDVSERQARLAVDRHKKRTARGKTK